MINRIFMVFLLAASVPVYAGEIRKIQLNPGMALAVTLIIFCIAGVLLVTRTIFSVIVENIAIKRKLLRPWRHFLRHRYFRPFFNSEFPENDIHSIIRGKKAAGVYKSP